MARALVLFQIGPSTTRRWTVCPVLLELRRNGGLPKRLAYLHMSDTAISAKRSAHGAIWYPEEHATRQVGLGAESGTGRMRPHLKVN